MASQGVVESSPPKVKTFEIMRGKHTASLSTPRREILPPLASKFASKPKKKLVLLEESPIEDPKSDIGEDTPIDNLIKKRRQTKERPTETSIASIPISMVSLSQAK